MSGTDRVNDLYLNGPDQLRTLVFAPPRQVSSSLPIAIKRVHNHTPPNPIASPASSTESESSRDILSRVSSTSTAPSSMHNDYDLPCEFALLGCSLRFHPEQFEAWVSHSASHFVHVPPPPRSICTFCDSLDFSSWRERMIHIASHFQALMPDESMRPDYFVIEYMWANGLLSIEDYTSAMRYTERPHCDGLVPFGHKTPEMSRKEEKSREQKYDLDKENRQMRRQRGKGKGKEKEKEKEKEKRREEKKEYTSPRKDLETTKSG